MSQGLTDTSKDNINIMYINQICHKILIKTNRRIFVPKLKYVVTDLVNNAYIMYLNI